MNLDPQAIAAALGNARREGHRWRTTCPACGGGNLTIGIAADDRLLVKCWNGCSQQQVVEALRQRELWPGPSRNGHSPAPPRPQAAGPGRPAQDGARWWAEYTGVPWQRWQAWGCEPLPNGVAFVWPSLPGVRKLRLKDGPKGLWEGSPSPPLWPELAPELPGEVWLTEGESDCGVLRHCGLEAYACTKGASSPPPGAVFAELRRRGCRTVTVAFDADAAGRQGAEKLAQAAAAAGLAVATVSWEGLLRPALGENDCRDLFRRLGDPTLVRQALEAAVRPWTPADDPASSSSSSPPFPLATLPDPHRSYVQQAAAALDCDPALVGVPYLAIAAGVLGCRVELQLTRSWQERAILWTAVVAPPGSAKSPALRLAMEPMLVLQQEAYEAWQEEAARSEEEKRAYERERAEAKRHGGSVPHPPAPPPELAHFYTADSTLEALTRILGHPRSRTPGVTVVRDELISWVKAFDAYSPKGERQVWLALWAGAPVKSDRAHRDPYVIPRPAVSVTGGITPDLLPKLEDEAGQRDGFIERLLFAMPPCRPLALVDTGVDPDVAQAVQDRLRLLRRCPEGTARLSPAAFAAFQAWHAENVRAQERTSGLVQGFYAKLPGHIARLALVLHALAHPHDPATVPVSVETMAAAITLGEYFRAHFLHVARHFGVVGAVQDSDALRLYRTIQRLGGSVTGRELNDAGWAAEAWRQAAERLVAAGLIRIETPPHEGPGRPGVRLTTATRNLHNLHNLYSGGLVVQDGEQAGEGEAAPEYEEFDL